MKYIIFLLFIFQCDLSTAKTKPLKTYISKSVYFAKYLTKKKSFEPFKEVKGRTSLHKFEFYKTYIVLKIGTKNTVLKIEKIKIPYQNTTSYFVSDKQGNRYLIDVLPEMYGSTNIDLFDLNKESVPETLTKCVCKAL